MLEFERFLNCDARRARQQQQPGPGNTLKHYRECNTHHSLVSEVTKTLKSYVEKSKDHVPKHIFSQSKSNTCETHEHVLKRHFDSMKNRTCSFIYPSWCFEAVCLLLNIRGLLIHESLHVFSCTQVQTENFITFKLRLTSLKPTVAHIFMYAQTGRQQDLQDVDRAKAQNRYQSKQEQTIQKPDQSPKTTRKRSNQSTEKD